MKYDKRIFKEQRTSLLHVRIKGSIFNLLSDMIQRKKKITKDKVSQADIIEEALKFADGQIVSFANEKINTSKEQLKKGDALLQSGKQLLITDRN